jgi:hypothetical protein
LFGPLENNLFRLDEGGGVNESQSKFLDGS